MFTDEKTCNQSLYLPLRKSGRKRSKPKWMSWKAFRLVRRKQKAYAKYKDTKHPAYKIRSTSTPSYLSRHIRLRGSARHLRSSAVPLLYKPTTRTRFADRAFRCTAPTVWNSLAVDVTSSCSLTVFKSRLKTHIFRQTFNLSD